jgi:hypothetical protein
VLMSRGYTAEESITYLRQSRSVLVLCNKDYEKWLLDLETRGND